MASVDVRLLPLIEALNSAGAVWIATELLDAIARGHVPLEPPERLKMARILSDELGTDWSEEPESATSAIEGLAQIGFATQYIETRLTDAINYLEAGLLQADDILDSDERPRARPAEISQSIEDGEQVLEVDRAAVGNARLAMEQLSSALREWRLQAEAEGQ